MFSCPSLSREALTNIKQTDVGWQVNKKFLKKIRKKLEKQLTVLIQAAAMILKKTKVAVRQKKITCIRKSCQVLNGRKQQRRRKMNATSKQNLEI